MGSGVKISMELTFLGRGPGEINKKVQTGGHLSYDVRDMDVPF